MSLVVKRRERKDTIIVLIKSLQSEECDSGERSADKHKDRKQWIAALVQLVILYYVLLYNIRNKQ